MNRKSLVGIATLVVIFVLVGCGFSVKEETTIGELKLSFVKFSNGKAYVYRVENGAAVQKYTFDEGDFSLSATEVTYGSWSLVKKWAVEKSYVFGYDGQAGSSGSQGEAVSSTNATQPVVGLSFADAMIWCNALTEMNGGDSFAYRIKTMVGEDVLKNINQIYALIQAGNADNLIVDNKASGFRMPSNFEWKYAAFSHKDKNGDGNITDNGEFYPFCSGNLEGLSKCGDYAWYKSNAEGKTHPVKGKLATETSLYDLCGNVREFSSIKPVFKLVEKGFLAGLGNIIYVKPFVQGGDYQSEASALYSEGFIPIGTGAIYGLGGWEFTTTSFVDVKTGFRIARNAVKK